MNNTTSPLEVVDPRNFTAEFYHLKVENTFLVIIFKFLTPK